MRTSEQNSWSVKLGRWAGVRVRLHVFFLLFALITLYQTWPAAEAQAQGPIDWLTLCSLVVLLLSVIWHEVGHYIAVTRLGGIMHQSVLVPWGGLSTFTIPRDPYLELIVPLAGPVASADDHGPERRGIAATVAADRDRRRRSLRDQSGQVDAVDQLVACLGKSHTGLSV